MKKFIIAIYLGFAIWVGSFKKLKQILFEKIYEDQFFLHKREINNFCKQLLKCGITHKDIFSTIYTYYDDRFVSIKEILVSTNKGTRKKLFKRKKIRNIFLIY